MSGPSQPADEVAAAGPVPAQGRITHLDALRGVAVLGILVMNAVSYGLEPAAYFNVSAGNATPLDWIIGVLGEIAVDQKFMGIFSILFGAGIVLFADRAADKGARANRLSLWRNLLLLGIGALHMVLWDGDILVVYAVAAPFLILVRRLPPRLLFVAGAAIYLVAPILSALFQTGIDADGRQLGETWLGEGDTADAIWFFLGLHAFLRAVGMMLIGVALYRTGVLAGQRSRRWYRRMAVVGLGVGLPSAALGVLIGALNDFAPNSALLSMIPNTLGTIPASLGWISLIILWNMRAPTAVHGRVRALGQMALTNYLTQTVLGVLVLRVALGGVNLTRTAVLGFIVVVWALQLWWSQAWLVRFRFGPCEWLWRVATYRRMQPLCR